MGGTKTIQAKDIDDAQILAIIRRRRANPSEGYTGLWQLVAELDPPMPWKVVRAKISSMMKRRVIEGCSCGCGSPMWELDEQWKLISR